MMVPRTGIQGLLQQVVFMHYGYALLALLFLATISFRLGWTQGHNHAAKVGWLWHIPGVEYLWAQKIVNWDYARVTENLPSIVNGAGTLMTTATQAAITGEGSDLASLLYKMAVPASGAVTSLSIASKAYRHYYPRGTA